MSKRKTAAQKAKEKYGRDPMYQMLEMQLGIAMEGASKGVKDPTGYMLRKLRKEGFEVYRTTQLKKKLQ